MSSSSDSNPINPPKDERTTKDPSGVHINEKAIGSSSGRPRTHPTTAAAAAHAAGSERSASTRPRVVVVSQQPKNASSGTDASSISSFDESKKNLRAARKKKAAGGGPPLLLEPSAAINNTEQQSLAAAAAGGSCYSDDDGRVDHDACLEEALGWETDAGVVAEHLAAAAGIASEAKVAAAARSAPAVPGAHNAAANVPARGKKEQRTPNVIRMSGSSSLPNYKDQVMGTAANESSGSDNSLAGTTESRKPSGGPDFKDQARGSDMVQCQRRPAKGKGGRRTMDDDASEPVRRRSARDENVTPGRRKDPTIRNARRTEEEEPGTTSTHTAEHGSGSPWLLEEEEERRDDRLLSDHHHPAAAAAEVLVSANLVQDPETVDGTAVRAIPMEEQEGKQRRYSRIAASCIVAVGLLVVAGAIIGAVLAATQQRREDSSASASAPAVGRASSLACRDAAPLALGEIVVSGTTNAGIVEDNVAVCGTVTAPAAPGTWFVYEPQRLTSAVRITTCTNDTKLNGIFDTQMVVFEEPITNGGSCDSLFCLQGNDNEGEDGCDTEAGVTFTPFPTKLYHILVYAFAEGGTGDFAIEAKAIEQTPANDKCPGAVPLRDGEIVARSTFNATTKDVSKFGVCGDAVPATSAGVWFSYTSDRAGSEVRITTCTSDSLLNGGYDSVMVVYRGDCQNLECVTGNDDEQKDACDREAGVTFRPDPLTTYIVYVYGRTEAEKGNFAVEAREP